MFLQALGSTTTTATAVLFFCSEGQGRVSRCFYSSDVLVLMCLPTSLVWGSSRLIAAPSSLHPPGPSVFSFLGGRMHFLLQETEEDTLFKGSLLSSLSPLSDGSSFPSGCPPCRHQAPASDAKISSALQSLFTNSFNCVGQIPP